MRNSKKNDSKLKQVILVFLTVIAVALWVYFDPVIQKYISGSYNEDEKVISFDLSSIPEYEDSPYVILDDNIPKFSEEDYLRNFEEYSSLDSLGRCGVAYANISKDTMPPEGDKRGDISSVRPSRMDTEKV